MLYRLFDLYIEIEERFPETKTRIFDYLANCDEKSDFKIKITDEEIEKERNNDSEKSNSYLEMVCILRHIAEKIPDYNGMFIHAAVVEKDGCGYLLTGKSGAGKSTQAAGWVDYFGKHASIINGDKPMLRFMPDGIYAYGSPWCGVEGFSKNTSVRLKSACFIEKSSENKIELMQSQEVFKRLLNQTIIPQKADRRIKHFELLDRLIKEIPFYMLECTISKEAVITAYEKMSK